MAGPSTTLKFLREEKWPESNGHKGVYLTPGPFWENNSHHLKNLKLMHESGTMNRLPGLPHTVSHLPFHPTVCLNASNH